MTTTKKVLPPGWQTPPLAIDGELEVERLATIDELDLLSDTPESSYNNVILLVQMASAMPIALFSVVADNRQFFKARLGLDALETPRDQAFCDWTIQQGDTDALFVVEDASLDDRFMANPLVLDGPEIRFYAGIPVLAPNDVPVGTICLIDSVARRFTHQIEATLRAGKQLMENSLLLRQEAVRDHLTGLFTRRFFDEMFEKELRRSYRGRLPLTVLMLDIDYFKPYNDCYGHPAGDQALRTVGQLLNDRAARAGDIVARYGGEEFVLVFPAMSLDGAESMASDIQEAFADLNIPHEESPVGYLTASIGGCVVLDKEILQRGPGVLIEYVDDMLYQAKDKGRNRYEIVAL